MEKIEAVARSVAAQAGPRSQFLAAADNDELLGITMALAGEVATLYERLDSLERVIEQDLGVPRQRLDAFAAGPEVLAERSRWHDAFVLRLMRSIQQELEHVRTREGPPIPEASAGE